MIASPRPIVDADRRGRRRFDDATSPHDPQQRIVADVDRQSTSQARGWAPSVIAKHCESLSSRTVRRACAGAASSIRSVKILREQVRASQKKRRTCRRKATGRPAIGRSDTVRAYRLCTRALIVPHTGQRADEHVGQTDIAAAVPSNSLSPADNPGGNNADSLRRRIALILLTNQAKATPRFHQNRVRAE
jgi:hypothetical protein